MHRLSAMPVRRDLQNRRTAQSAMRDQHLLAETAARRWMRSRRPTVPPDRNSFAIIHAERERHQRGTRYSRSSVRIAAPGRSRSEVAPIFGMERPPVATTRASSDGILFAVRPRSRRDAQPRIDLAVGTWMLTPAAATLVLPACVTISRRNGRRRAGREFFRDSECRAFRPVQ